MPTYRDYHFAHASEKAAFEQLQSLDDGHIHLWPTIEGAGLHETDLFLIDDGIGAFVIELKAYPISSIHQFNADCMWVTNNERKRSAIKQAQTQLHALRSYVDRAGGYFPPTVATVLWTNISRREWQQTWAKNKQALELGNGMLFREDIDSGITHFRRQLLTIFEKPAIRQAYTAAVVPALAIQDLIALLGNKSAERSDETDRQMLEKFERYYRGVAQERAPLDSVSRITLIGVPGTGKTWQLLSIAKYHAENGKNVLFLCYNHVLRTNIEQMVSGFRKGNGYGSITVHTIFDHIGLLNETGTLGCSLVNDDYDSFAGAVIDRMVETDFLWEAYDTVLMDEAQDLKDYVGQLLETITRDNTSIAIGVGIGQDLYLDAMSVWLRAFMEENETSELEKVYRTTAQTFQAAQIVCEAFSSNEKIEVVARRVLAGKCHGMHEEVRPLRNIGRPPAVRRYKVDVHLQNDTADMHAAGIRTQIEAIIGELEPQEKYSDILFLIPSKKSPTYVALVTALATLGIPFIDFTVKANRDTTARDHQVRISTFHSCRGVEAGIAVLLDLERLAERKNARQQLYIGLTRAVRLAIVLEPDIAVSQLATLLERAAACINAASTQQDFKKNIPARAVKLPPATVKPSPKVIETKPADQETPSAPSDESIIDIPDTMDDEKDIVVAPQLETTQNEASAAKPVQEETKVEPPSEIKQPIRHEPSGFGTSIFAVMADKAKRGKQISAIYDWSTFIDVSAE
jgi:hypothetical protein